MNDSLKLSCYLRTTPCLQLLGGKERVEEEDMKTLFLSSLHLERAVGGAWSVGLARRQALGEAFMRHKAPRLSDAKAALLQDSPMARSIFPRGR